MQERIVLADPNVQGGTPVFAGTRVPVKNLFDYLAAGETLDSFLLDFPSVERAKALATLEMACEGRGSIRIRFDKLNELGGRRGRSLSLRCLERGP